MRSSALHNGLFGVACILFILGALLGVGGALNYFFGDEPLSGPASEALGRLLAILFTTSAGIWHMLAYHNYRLKRQERRIRG